MARRAVAEALGTAFLLAAVIGFSTSLLLGVSRALRAGLYPWLLVLQMTPVIVLTPIILLWAGQGVGLAIVIGGRLHRGFTGAAGEIGWMPVAGAHVYRDPSHKTKGGFQQLVQADRSGRLAELTAQAA